MTDDVLRRECAWCKSVLDGLGPILPHEEVTHTICQPCRGAHFAKYLRMRSLEEVDAEIDALDERDYLEGS